MCVIVVCSSETVTANKLLKNLKFLLTNQIPLFVLFQKYMKNAFMSRYLFLKNGLKLKNMLSFQQVCLAG